MGRIIYGENNLNKLSSGGQSQIILADDEMSYACFMTTIDIPMVVSVFAQGDEK